MARVSRKNKSENQPTKNFRVWNTAIYGRVSKYNSGQEDAESLEVQLYYVSQYVERRSELRLVDVYADNGCTGTNFDRPEFERLLNDIQQKKIDCVVVKDLSRFGRNVIDTGYFLEKLFPFLGVRFIAVNENYDSENTKQRDGMVLPIKDLMNEFYSRDLSRKVRSTFALKRERGDNLHVVPFGYQKDADNTGRLVLDEEVCGYVTKMFEWKRDGLKNTAIAKKLNALKIPIPHERRKQLGLVKTQGRVTRTEWISEDVRHILINPVYTGSMVYNRYGYPNGYRKSCVMNPREEWIVVKNAHPAIISEALFEAVYALVGIDLDVYMQKRQCREELWNQQPNLFQSKVFCMNCKSGLRMERVKSLGKPRFQKLRCTHPGCTNHTAIAEPLLRILIMDQIRLQLSAYIDRKELAENYQKQSGVLEKKKKLIEQRNRSQVKLKELKQRKRVIYEEYAQGDWQEEDYRELRKVLTEKERVAEEELLMAEQQVVDFQKLFANEDMLETLLGDDFEKLSFSKELLDTLMSRIEIGENYTLALTFSFEDQVMKKAELMEVIL